MLILILLFKDDRFERDLFFLEGGKGEKGLAKELLKSISSK